MGARVDYFFTISGNGQVSIPAPVRARWNTRRVVVADLGDYIAIRPLPDDPRGALIGKYADLGGPTVDEWRTSERESEHDDAVLAETPGR